MSKVVEKIFKTESVKDIITVFALIRPLPALDGMFNRYRREAFVSGEFAEVYGRLLRRASWLMMVISRLKALTGKRHNSLSSIKSWLRNKKYR